MVDQVKVIEIGADAIEAVFRDQPLMAMTYPPKLMHAVVAALGRHGFIIEDRYEDTVDASDVSTEAPSSPIRLPGPTGWSVDHPGPRPMMPDLTNLPGPPDLTERLQTLGKTAADWEVEGDDA